MMLRRKSDAKALIPAVIQLASEPSGIESRRYTARPIVQKFRVETPLGLSANRFRELAMLQRALGNSRATAPHAD